MRSLEYVGLGALDPIVCVCVWWPERKSALAIYNAMTMGVGPMTDGALFSSPLPPPCVFV